MNCCLLFCVVAVASALEPVKPQAKALFTYQPGASAAYPAGAVTVKYSALTDLIVTSGASIVYPYATTLMFPAETEFYTRAGPKLVVAGANLTIAAGSQVTFSPGTLVKYLTAGETRYDQINGNSHVVVSYPSGATVDYYTTNSNLILFAPGTNPLNYYNPGGSTRFGYSALPVERDPGVPVPGATSRTYGGGSYGGSYGYSYCSGYSYNGYPQTSYYNNNYGTPYYSTCYQTCYNCYSYQTNNAPYYGATSAAYYGGGGGGGGGMYGGGSTYGGGGTGYNGYGYGR